MNRLVILIYALIGISSLVLGLLYIFSPSFMPYHAVAVGTEWEAVPPAYQILIGALLDVAGAGWLSLAVALGALIAFPLRRAEAWARYTAPLLILAFNVPTLWATVSVLRHSPAAPPWFAVAGTCAFAILALAIDRPWISRAENRPADGP